MYWPCKERSVVDDSKWKDALPMAVCCGPVLVATTRKIWMLGFVNLEVVLAYKGVLSPWGPSRCSRVTLWSFGDGRKVRT